MNSLALGLLGIGVLVALWLTHARPDPRVQALKVLAARHGLRLRRVGKGLQLVGGHRGRAFSLTWQPEEVLLVAVDCAALEGVQDGALINRWTRPPPDLFQQERLEALIAEMVDLAEERETTQPAEPEVD